MALKWKELQQDLAHDGALRDLYVVNTNEADWAMFLNNVPHWSDSLEYTVDGRSREPPKSFPREDTQVASTTLSAIIGPLRINCHFFCETELELDLDPREVDGQEALDLLTGFMRQIGQTLSKTVVLTPENGLEHPIASYEPKHDRFKYWPTGANDAI